MNNQHRYFGQRYDDRYDKLIGHLRQQSPANQPQLSDVQQRTRDNYQAIANFAPLAGTALGAGIGLLGGPAGAQVGAGIGGGIGQFAGGMAQSRLDQMQQPQREQDMRYQQLLGALMAYGGR